jgi:hypothetical protein
VQALFERVIRTMNQLEQAAQDVREFAREVHKLAYSSLASLHETQFLDYQSA